jgi:hypothetical protein
VREFTEAEFEQWLREGRFEQRMIDGEQRFLNVSVSNLFFRHAELEARRLKLAEKAGLAGAYYENAMDIRAAARARRQPYAQPKRFRVRMTLTVATHAVTVGENVRAWLPVPRRYPFQDAFELLRSAPAAPSVADAESPIRSAYFEQVVAPGASVGFEIEYAYTAHGVSFDLQPEQWRPLAAPLPALQPFTAEAPHVVFTERMRRLATEIGSAETNALRKAKRFYDWLAENVRYSFAPEYSTLRNLSDCCLTNRFGDCGQQALLFITLCRESGIPARWQSGWSIFPSAQTIHDWCEIYLLPWGWVPVDPYMGGYAMRYATRLTPEQRRELRDFYFGGRNLYFDQFKYRLTWEEVSAREAGR